MSHVDGKFCDEGFRCKKCKAAWMKQTEIESLRAKVKELEEKHDVACQTINQLQRHRDTLQGSLARQMQAFLDEQSKVKVLADALGKIGNPVESCENCDRSCDTDKYPCHSCNKNGWSKGESFWKPQGHIIDSREALATFQGEK